MEQITEDYCSFGTAKLLKEKGFDWNTDKQFNSDKIVGDYNITDRSRYPERYLDAPTLQMAMKWLREVHKLYCDIKIGDGDFVIDIISLKDGEFGCEVAEPESCVYSTYEEACEAAIRYCLENLI